jgi:hypothetical protein
MDISTADARAGIKVNDEKCFARAQAALRTAKGAPR